MISDPAAERAVRDLYDNLKRVFVEQKHQLGDGSVFLGLMAMGSKNRRRRVLVDAAIPVGGLGRISDELVAAGLADYSVAGKKITLSAAGIWEAELLLEVSDSARLLRFVDEKWFDCFAEEKAAPNEKEKIVLFTLLAARAFSADTGVNLNVSRNHEAWTSLVLSVASFMASRGIIRDAQSVDVLKSEATGTLRPVVKFFRYTEYLQKKTDVLYVPTGQNNYYLNLDEDGTIDPAKLTFLFRLVLEDRGSFELVDAVAEFCRESAYDMATKVRAKNGTAYASPDCDQLIDDALRSWALGH